MNCGVKLKPQLKQAVNSLGLPLDGYSDIVATICNESNSEVEPNDGDFSSQKVLCIFCSKFYYLVSIFLHLC